MSNRPLDSFLLLQSGFIALAVLVVVLLEGCSAGIQSNVPLIANGERIDSATGYWMLLSRESRIRGTEFVPIRLDDDEQDKHIVYLEENYSGFPFFRDYYYKLTSLSLGQYSKQKVFKGVIRTVTGRNGHLFQICELELEGAKIESRQPECFYALGKVSDGVSRLRRIIDDDITSPMREALGIVYLNAKDRDNITLPDAFVTHSGRDFVKATIDSPASWEDVVRKRASSEDSDQSTSIITLVKIPQSEALTRNRRARNPPSKAK